MAAVHLRCGNGVDFFIWQFSRRKAAFLRLETGEGFIFIGGHKISGNMAVAADGHSSFLC